jgi:hypothetical protein|tara:strand:+ start:539 stop:1024 length:486 start_codon:yes stop_codon:yes gene_type:complete
MGVGIPGGPKPTKHPNQRRLQMKINIKTIIEDMDTFVTGWRKYAADKKLSDLSLESVETDIKDLVDHEKGMKLMKQDYRGMIAPRTSKAMCLRDKRRRLVAAVKADPELGENSAFWRSLGFKTLEEQRGSRSSEGNNGTSENANDNPATNGSNENLDTDET